jgi:hypothetical protein
MYPIIPAPNLRSIYNAGDYLLIKSIEPRTGPAGDGGGHPQKYPEPTPAPDSSTTYASASSHNFLRTVFSTPTNSLSRTASLKIFEALIIF